MAEHVCKCRECKPEAFPEVSPRTLGYMSARHDQNLHPKVITVDGQTIELFTAFEALSGDNGWVIYFSKTPHIHPCTCRQCACADVKYGRVEFEY